MIEVSVFSDGGQAKDLQKPVAHATVTYSLTLLGSPIESRTIPEGATEA